MRYFQSKNLCMKERKIVAGLGQGMPNREYPNSDLYCYHDFYELEYFEKGQGVHYINGVPYPVKKGYAYLLFPGDVHHINLDEDVEFELYNLKLDIDVPNKKIVRELQEFKRPLCVYTNETDGEIIKNEFLFLINVIQNKTYNAYMEENISERVLNVFLCALEKGAKAGAETPNEQIWQVIKYIENNFSKDINLSDISKLMGLSENYICFYFKKHVGMSFVKYMNKTRLFYAANLLNETNMSIKEIAFEVGFHSPEYFTRIFCSVFGKTPKEYRKEMKKS